MSLPRGNYDPRRVCLNPFPEFTLGKHRRTVGVYLAGALVGLALSACIPFDWYIVSLPLQTGHFWTLPFSLLTPKRPTVPYRKRNPPCTSLSLTGFLESVRCSATSLSTLSTRIGFEEMKDSEIRELFGGRDYSCLSGLPLWREVLLAVWCVYCLHSWTLLMTMSAADCLGFEVHLKRVLRAVHLLRLRQCLPKRCPYAFCCCPLDSSEHEQRVWVQPYSLNSRTFLSSMLLCCNPNHGLYFWLALIPRILSHRTSAASILERKPSRHASPYQSSTMAYTSLALIFPRNYVRLISALSDGYLVNRRGFRPLPQVRVHDRESIRSMPIDATF